MKKSIVIIVIVVLAVIGYFALIKNDTITNIDDSSSDENIPGTTQQVPAAEDDVEEMIVDQNGEDDDNIPEEEQKPVTGDDPQIPPTEEETPPPPAEEEEAPVTIHTITFDGTSYSPNVLNVQKGDVVTWVNESNRVTWPASVVHPSHNVYPVGGGCLGSTLDACRAMENGESFSFTFDEVGAWKMHDHRAPFITMTVVVAE